MSPKAHSLWTDFKTDFVKKHDKNKVCEPWLQPIKITQMNKTDKGVWITLQVPSELHKNWAQQYLVKSLASGLSNKLKENCFIQLEIAAHLPSSNIKIETETAEEEQSTPKKKTNFFHPEYTFENFIVGRHNELAHGAAFSISQAITSPCYNPLFIFSPSGLGKTHLLNAIGQSALEKHPHLNILYLSAERFLNEYVLSLKRKAVPLFRKKYRKNCDLLLMDDIQMVTKGPRIQEEFFHTFNALFDRKVPVVVCCDKPPNKIPELQERIQTRLEGGLVVDMSYPEFETRLAILKYKTDQKHISLSDKSSTLIAKKCKRSVRELEGVLNKIKMLSELQEKNLSEETIQKILKDLNHTELTADEIQKQVAEKFNLSVEALKSPSRIKNIVTARHLAMFLIKKHLHRSLSDIGRLFGGRDHSTVLNSLKKVEKLSLKDTDFKVILEDLHNKIHIYKKEN